jgi:hypothetical protein
MYRYRHLNAHSKKRRVVAVDVSERENLSSDLPTNEGVGSWAVEHSACTAWHLGVVILLLSVSLSHVLSRLWPEQSNGGELGRAETNHVSHLVGLDQQ